MDDTSLGGETSIGHSSRQGFDVGHERADFDGIEIMDADDGRLGLTNIGRVPADDWAADTGDTVTSEGVE